MQDHHEKLQDIQYIQQKHQRLSGVHGGKTGELASLLISMHKTIDEWSAKRNADNNKRTHKKVNKETAGEQLPLAAFKRDLRSNSKPFVLDENTNSDAPHVNRMKRRTMQPKHKSEFDFFGT